eukprot:scaffold93387_cov53-Attheya_sp.AAC.1
MDAVSKRCSTERRKRTIVNRRRRPRYERSSSCIIGGWYMVIGYALCGTLRLVVAESASRSNLGIARSFLHSRSTTAFVKPQPLPRRTLSTFWNTPNQPPLRIPPSQENWNKHRWLASSSRNSEGMSSSTTSTILSPAPANDDGKETKKAQF